MTMNAKQHICALFLAGLLLPGMAVAQKLYKYRDADGTVVYSQRKPPEVDAKEVRLIGVQSADTEAREKLEDTNQALDERSQARNDATEKSPEELERDAAIKRNCKVATANLKVLQSGTRVVANDKNGKPYYVDDAEAARKKAEAERQVAEFCA